MKSVYFKFTILQRKGITREIKLVIPFPHTPVMVNYIMSFKNATIETSVSDPGYMNLQSFMDNNATFKKFNKKIMKCETHANLFRKRLLYFIIMD